MKKIPHILSRWNSWVPITISVIALSISGISFYYQNLRINNDVKSIILGFTIENNKPYTYLTDVVFVNDGNRPCSIINVAVILQNTRLVKLSLPEIMDLAKNKKEGIPPATMISDFRQEPFSIEPRSIVTKRLTFGFGIPDNTFRPFGELNDILKISLIIQLVDSGGNYHKIVTVVGHKIVGENGYSFELCPLSVRLLPSITYKGKDFDLVGRIQITQIGKH
jgi:hypothetical protein